jgi:hypothetical protein
VIKSQLQADGREFLSLLYADPFTGPGLVLAGSTRKVGSVELTVQPLSKGAAYGWLDYDGVSDEDLRAHSDAVIAGNKPPIVEIDEADMPGVHGLPSQENESNVDRKSRLANVAHQHPELVAREVADGSGTGRYGDGAEHWTETGDGRDYPGSYGVGPTGSDGQPLKRFVPLPEGTPAREEANIQEPVVETRTYPDGTRATGVAPLPDQSPMQQNAADGRLQPHGVDETYSAPDTVALTSEQHDAQQ